MNKKILLTLILGSGCISLCAQEKLLKKGMVITENTVIRKGIYNLDGGKDLEQPVILIDGYDITVDFNNAALRGSSGRKNPDEFFGVAVIISNKSTKITIKNLKARGYKVAILAKDVSGLTLENCDLSYNYRQHLNSTREKEDISDWMSYHHNEKDEWLRYGAAISLRNCNLAIIKNCKVTGGQNALMMTNCNDGLVINNDFSFNSGIGIGMYRCGFNEVAYNKIDFNVRGYSDGVYSRGQDSAGILVYEQSTNNLFYKNSVTHGGDGFFLWAGQTTMDSGKGGCNDNILFGNDFSYAPANGIEITFSRNKIFKNRIFECDYGIWGGYSYNTEIANNQFRNNNAGVAIEHGQENDIHHNLFFKDKTAIKLWAGKEEPADWGYAKYRDTRSRNYNLVSNSYNQDNTAIDLIRTDSIKIFGDYISNTALFLKTDSTVTNVDTTQDNELADKFSIDSAITGPFVEKPNDPFKGNGKLAGRKNILINEWGPYDFRSPIIWNTNPTDTSGIMQFEIMGPPGKWKIKSFRGLDSISSKNGIIPAAITAKNSSTGGTNINIQLEYTGEEVKTQFGETIPKGTPFIFSFKRFFQPMNWNVMWYSLDSSAYDSIKTGKLILTDIKWLPIKTESTQKLDYAWWGGIKNGDSKTTQFLTMAEGKGNFKKGNYEFGVTWDHAVRIYIDDKLVIDEWEPSKNSFEDSPHERKILSLEGGTHLFRVEHIGAGDFATLAFKIRKME